MDWLGEGCHDFVSHSGCEARSDLNFVLPWLHGQCGTSRVDGRHMS